MLRGEDAWSSAELKRRPATGQVPSSSPTVADERSGFALGADAYLVKPIDRDTLRRCATDAAPWRTPRPDRRRRGGVAMLRQHLLDGDRVVVEAGSGHEALRRARDDRPDVVCS
jgi:CheY-like chemotaxis protein